MKLIIIRGSLGVGKTTVALLLAEQIGAEYISIDTVLEEYRLDQHIPADAKGIPVDRYLLANAVSKSGIDSALMNGRPVILDGCFYYRQPIDELLRWYPKITMVISLTADLKICIQRDADRKKPYGEDAARAVYKLVDRVQVGTVVDASGDIRSTVKTIRGILQI